MQTSFSGMVRGVSLEINGTVQVCESFFVWGCVVVGISQSTLEHTVTSAD